ncbi:transposase [Streptomyces sp. NPDC005925]|uniref:IS701 family transposase n=1 Tax=Streptomyces sp. NPDC005925 TaxID=3157172 RepID=UPI0033D8183B
MATECGEAYLQTFLDEIFTPLHRAEQRRWARAYLRGLLRSTGKKTLRRIARTESLPPTAAQGLHQFINASPWAWEPVRRRLALGIAANTTPYAWTVAELVIPKRGEHSVGVHRQIDTATGCTVNGQRAVGLFLAADTRCFPVAWSLVLDDGWAQDRRRRSRARIPEEETARSVRAYVLDHAAAVVEQPRLPGLPWVLDLTRCQDANGVLSGLARHRLHTVCEVAPTQTVLVGRAVTPTRVGELMEVRRSRQPRVIACQTTDGPARAVPVYAYAGTIRLPRRRGAGRPDTSSRTTYHVLKCPSPDRHRPARYWITSLIDRSVEEVMALVRGQAAARTALVALRERFGVLDFEGRSFPGWHHHMTMASAAYAFQYLWADPGSGHTAAPTRPPFEAVS